jgi:superfamily II DNA/RNA helicase
MADMGFLPVVRRLLNQTRNDRQTILYSATLDGDVGKVIREYQNNPVRHEVGAATPDLTTMTHLFWKIPRPERIPLCASVIQTFGRTIVFSRTRHGADRATRQLAKLGIQAAAIHGNRSQGQRQRALADFGSGKVQALVATDVAARGIHVDAVECVLHFDPVDEDSAYVHRSGRTARAGASGHVVSFVDPGQMADVQKMKKRLNLPQEITDPPQNDGFALPNLPTSETPKPRSEKGPSHQSQGEQHEGQQRQGQQRQGGEQRPSEKRQRGQRGPKKKHPQIEGEQRSEGGKRPAKKSAKKPGKSRKQRAQRNSQTKGAPSRNKQSRVGGPGGGQPRKRTSGGSKQAAQQRRSGPTR